MNPVQLGFPFFPVALHLDGIYDSLGLFGGVIAGSRPDLLMDFMAQPLLVDLTVQVK